MASLTLFRALSLLVVMLLATCPGFSSARSLTQDPAAAVAVDGGQPAQQGQTVQAQGKGKGKGQHKGLVTRFGPGTIVPCPKDNAPGGPNCAVCAQGPGAVGFVCVTCAPGCKYDPKSDMCDGQCAGR